MQRKLMLLGLIGLSLMGVCHAYGRILGGEEADPTATPYAASLRVDNAHVCGGSILSETKILTTAHCVHRDGNLIDASRLSCRVGSTNQYAGGRIYTVESVVVHPEYYSLKNNLAVITLSSALAFTDRIQAIPVAASGESLPAEGAEVTVAGWGRTTDGTTSYKIRELELTVAQEAACLDAYSDHDGDSFCLAHELREGTCHGDGGSGAVYGGKLIGLTNFVVGACGSRYPDVFVRLSSYADWIQEQIA
ncbi:LOW QUALITY PROTEIN: chymotrypsin-1 [Drosophila ficusphila]|uniref:LOW QUALITY PROTEIN: chymotrypsin-1 n=1 Tax=Drosophila ficusphila TaxID=30025 RepID=UPI0007E62FC9|nr:LOW QUALITY PROTEIN: chymotrypsin-1 [Drosophila ficusphila]